MPLRRAKSSQAATPDGLAEAHLVGKQHPLAKHKMQHAFVDRAAKGAATGRNLRRRP
jgi:hypothetical protein